MLHCSAAFVKSGICALEGARLRTGSRRFAGIGMVVPGRINAACGSACDDAAGIPGEMDNPRHDNRLEVVVLVLFLAGFVVTAFNWLMFKALLLGRR